MTTHDGLPRGVPPADNETGWREALAKLATLVEGQQVRRGARRMYRVDTRIEIDAPAERVWSLLIDFPGHARWNPFVRSIEGILRVGASLQVFIQPPGSAGMRFRPKVLVCEAGRELRWKGKLLMPGLFDGEHYFRLEPRGARQVVFHHGEVFSGLLVPLFRRALDGATRKGFEAMNEALKREAER